MASVLNPAGVSEPPAESPTPNIYRRDPTPTGDREIVGRLARAIHDEELSPQEAVDFLDQHLLQYSPEDLPQAVDRVLQVRGKMGVPAYRFATLYNFSQIIREESVRRTKNAQDVRSESRSIAARAAKMIRERGHGPVAGVGLENLARQCLVHSPNSRRELDVWETRVSQEISVDGRHVEAVADAYRELRSMPPTQKASVRKRAWELHRNSDAQKLEESLTRFFFSHTEGSLITLQQIRAGKWSSSEEDHALREALLEQVPGGESNDEENDRAVAESFDQSLADLGHFDPVQELADASELRDVDDPLLQNLWARDEDRAVEQVLRGEKLNGARALKEPTFSPESPTLAEDFDSNNGSPTPELLSLSERARKIAADDAREIAFRMAVERVRAYLGEQLSRYMSRVAHPRLRGETPERYRARLEESRLHYESFLTTEVGQCLLGYVAGLGWEMGQDYLPEGDWRETGHSIAREVRVQSGARVAEELWEAVSAPLWDYVRSASQLLQPVSARSAPDARDGELRALRAQLESLQRVSPEEVEEAMPVAAKARAG